MNTSEKIAKVVAQFIASDREEDRKRIAELERDNNAVVQCYSELCQSIDVYLAEIQRLNEKCAALVAENRRIREDDEPEQKPLDVAAMNRALDAAGVPPVKQESTLRIDPDISDPQPGKLLVVQLDDEDANDIRCDEGSLCIKSQQFVGFLVETPAVKRTPKVGDKVRIIVRADLTKYGEVGEVGTVTQVDSGTAWVDGVGVDGPWCHYINNLEVIE